MIRKIKAGIIFLLAAFPLFGATDPSAFYQKGTIYLDWLGTLSPEASPRAHGYPSPFVAPASPLPSVPGKASEVDSPLERIKSA